MKRLPAFLFTFFAAYIFIISAAHACTNPAGSAGDTIYNKDFAVMQYCDTTNWIAMNNVDNGLVAHYRLDETSGTTATDSSKNSSNGTMGGGLSGANNSLTGVIENALTFDGVDDFISVPDTASLNPTSAITVSAWINFVDNGAEQIILGKPFNDGSHLNPFFSYSLQILTNERPRFYLNTGLGIRSLTGNTDIPQNEWQHIVATFDGQFIRIYRNAIEDATPNDLGSVTTLPVYNTPLYLGKNGGNAEDYLGALDDVRIYDRVLSPTEITALYNAGRDRGLIAHWKLDETTGTIAFDSSPLNSNGNMLNSLSSSDSVTGKIDRALDFDSNDFIGLGVVNELQRNLPVTITAWVNLPNSSEERFIFSSEAPPNNYSGYSCFINDVANFKIHARIGDSAGNDSINIRSKGGDTLLQNNRWYHAACVINSPTDMRVYLNGVDDGGTYTGSATSMAHSGTNGSNIGRGTRTAGHTFYGGKMDDLRIYSRALSTDEIEYIYNQRFISCTNPNGYEGDTIYNDTSNVMQYCNGTSWMAMGPVGDGGAGCTGPVGAAGDMIYNEDFNVMQYCEGDTWIGIGK